MLALVPHKITERKMARRTEMELLVHAINCSNANCGVSYCKRAKRIQEHVVTCTNTGKCPCNFKKILNNCLKFTKNFFFHF